MPTQGSNTCFGSRDRKNRICKRGFVTIYTWGLGLTSAIKPASVAAGSPGATVALRLLKERADSAETRAAAAARQIAELKASLQVKQVVWSLSSLPSLACY